MKKIFSLLTVLLFVFCMVGYSQVETQLNGTTVGGTAIRLNFIGDVGVTGAGTDKIIQIGGAASGVQYVVTNDTLTAAETGDIVIVEKQTGGGPTVITLPTAAVGLKFVVASAGTDTVHLTPQSTDTIDLAPSSVPLSQGDLLTNSSSTTGDSVSVVSGLANVWHIFNINGTWADGN